MRVIRPEKPQLHMVWPVASLPTCPPAAPPAGYSVRTYVPGDERVFLSLMSRCDFDPWDETKLAYNLGRALPEGWFLAVDASQGIVATAMCLHNYSGNSPFTGDLGWVACDPAHRGQGLGLCLSAHATRRFIAAGYTAIELHTEYFRLAAIKTYLRLGYVPSSLSADTMALWEDVCSELGWPFTPEAWDARA